jgi:hypothetical protein
LADQKSTFVLSAKVNKEVFLERSALLLGNLWTEACLEPAILVFNILEHTAHEVLDLNPEIAITAKIKTMKFTVCKRVHELWEQNIVKKTMDLYRPKG